MPRKPRVYAESKTYHVMMRGNERKTIFLDDEDQIRFLDTLHVKKKKGEFNLYAYCLMGNHVHLILSEGIDPLSLSMRRINTSFASYFNKKYKRVGHVFQDRFRSEPIESDSYLLAAIRYVHNNPVKAGITKSPWQYRWSSYQLYLTDHTSDLVDCKNVLDIFSTDTRQAIKAFCDYSIQDSDEELIDLHQNSIEDLEETGRDIIKKCLEHHAIALDTINRKEHTTLRNQLIKELKTVPGLSIRHIARLLDINRNVIQRIK